MTRRRISGWISFTQLVCVVVGFPLFCHWAVWQAVISRTEAQRQFGVEAIPTRWAAVLVDHGTPREWKRGTISEHPFLFGLNTLGVLICVGVLNYTVRKSEQPKDK